MDKIKKKWPDNVELRNKVNEMVDNYNEIIDDIKMIISFISDEDE